MKNESDTLTTQLADTLTDDQRKTLENIGTGDHTPTKRTRKARNTVAGTLTDVPKRVPRGRAGKGPLTRAEIGARMDDEHATIENFTDPMFIEGIGQLVEACLEDGVNQEKLGQFVENWKMADASVKLAILKALPGGLAPELQADDAEKVELKLYHLAFAVFMPAHEELLEDAPAGQNQRLGEKRLSNWSSAYRKAQAKAMDIGTTEAQIKEREQWLQDVERGAISLPQSILDTIKAAKSPVTEKAKSDKPATLRSVPKALNAMYVFVAETFNNDEQVRTMRAWLLAATIKLGYTDAVVAEAILKTGKA